MFFEFIKNFNQTYSISSQVDRVIQKKDLQFVCTSPPTPPPPLDPHSPVSSFTYTGEGHVPQTVAAKFPNSLVLFA